MVAASLFISGNFFEPDWFLVLCFNTCSVDLASVSTLEVISCSPFFTLFSHPSRFFPRSFARQVLPEAGPGPQFLRKTGHRPFLLPFSLLDPALLPVLSSQCLSPSRGDVEKWPVLCGDCFPLTAAFVLYLRIEDLNSFFFF